MSHEEELLVDLKASELAVSLDGRYELFEKLGSGGLGVVYRARQLSTGRVVAIKFLKGLETDAKTRLRFEQEAKAMSLLSHPNLVSVIDYGVDEEKGPYMAIDFVEGGNLQDFLAKESKLSPESFRQIFLQICRGLSHAHARGVIHRDLKPGNIMICKDETGDYLVKIVDFGIARNESALTRATQTGEVIGSPAYMSPEQAQGFQVDLRSDIYSLGCLMYECLTGKLPFEADSPLQTLLKRLNEDPPKFEAGGLEYVVLKAMQREPEKRYANAAELQSDLGLSEKDLLAKKQKEERASRQFLRKAILALACFVISFSVWALFDILGFSGALNYVCHGDNLMQAGAREALATTDEKLGMHDLARMHAEKAVQLLQAASSSSSNSKLSQDCLLRAAELTRHYHLEYGDLAYSFRQLGQRFTQKHELDSALWAYSNYWSVMSDQRAASAAIHKIKDLEEQFLLTIGLNESQMQDSPEQDSIDSYYNNLRGLAWVYYEKKRVADAIWCMDRISEIPSLKTNHARQALICLDKAEMYRWSSLKKEAEQEYFKAEKLAAQAHDYYWKGVAMAMSAETYSSQEDYVKAEKMAKEGVALIMSSEPVCRYGDYFVRLAPHAFELAAKSYVDQLRTADAYDLMLQGYGYLEKKGLAEQYLKAKSEEEAAPYREFLSHFRLILTNEQIQKTKQQAPILLQQVDARLKSISEKP